jgi:hypothetical protein
LLGISILFIPEHSQTESKEKAAVIILYVQNDTLSLFVAHKLGLLVCFNRRLTLFYGKTKQTMDNPLKPSGYFKYHQL